MPRSKSTNALVMLRSGTISFVMQSYGHDIPLIVPRSGLNTISLVIPRLGQDYLIHCVKIGNRARPHLSTCMPRPGQERTISITISTVGPRPPFSSGLGQDYLPLMPRSGMGLALSLCKGQDKPHLPSYQDPSSNSR
jgi:hypothetical protein